MNIFSIFKPKKKQTARVRNQNGMYARKVKIGGLGSGSWYAPSQKGFIPHGK